MSVGGGAATHALTLARLQLGLYHIPHRDFRKAGPAHAWLFLCGIQAPQTQDRVVTAQTILAASTNHTC